MANKYGAATHARHLEVGSRRVIDKYEDQTFHGTAATLITVIHRRRRHYIHSLPTPISRQIQHHPALEFTTIHLRKHGGQVLHLLGPEVGFDDPPCGKVQRLDSLATVAHG